MKKILYFAIPAFVVMVSTSCSKEKISVNQSSKPENSSISQSKLINTASNFSDQELFEGIFFLKGPVTDEVVALHDLRAQMDASQLEELDLRSQGVLNVINAEGPTNFLSEFGNSIRLGDNQSISAAFSLVKTTMANLEIEAGDATPTELVEVGKKKKEKWAIIEHFLIKRKKFDDPDEVMDFNPLEEEDLISSIVESFTE